MKKLDGLAAKVIKEMIQEEETVYEIDGKKYQSAFIEKSDNTVKEDIERDPELELKLKQAKKDILNGDLYTTDNVIEMIEQGEI